MTGKIKAKAVVIGVGAERGLGAALARRFARERHVIVNGRTEANLDRAVDGIRQAGGSAEAFPGDATDPPTVRLLLEHAMADGPHAPADLIAYNAGHTTPLALTDTTDQDFEEGWRVNCFGAFLVGRELIRHLMPDKPMTIFFTGSKASRRGLPKFAASSSAKFALRGLAQSMAREYGPQGLHVAHMVLDGGIDGERMNTRYPGRREALGPDALLDIDAIAEAFWAVHCQPPTAWTHEMELRPRKQEF